MSGMHFGDPMAQETVCGFLSKFIQEKVAEVSLPNVLSA